MKRLETLRNLARLGPIGLLVTSLVAPAFAASGEWPEWRGPSGNGVADGKPPIEWADDKNILFRTELPGLGISTPVVWDDLLFLTVAIDTGKGPDGKPGEKDRSGRVPGNIHQFAVIAYDRNTGTESWRTVVREDVPHEGSHPTSTWASNSPATDGEVLIANFGSQGIYGLDLSGKVLWEKDFGKMNTRNEFGEGSSPALHGGTTVMLWDHEGDSFIVALDKKTGAEKWRQPREERSSWSTPLLVEHDGRVQVITNATTNVRSYDLENGELIWQTTGMTDNVIPSPVYADGVVYVMSGFRGNKLLAIGLEGAQGDITGSEQIRWSYDRDTPYVSSPVLYENRLYFFKVLTPILTAFDVKKGEPLFGPVRIEELGNIYASPLAANGHIYLVDRQGATVVLEAGDTYKVAAVNQLSDAFDASPIAVGDVLYLRGRDALWAIGAKPDA
jgi:outer membrane protein assembly factor BamB